MNELLAKISSYNIFNYLVPGALFVISADRLGIAKLNDPDLATKLLIFYIIGLIVSRVGSLLLEPIMKRVHLARYANYKDYVLACAKDGKIEVLVEVCNTYRTMATVFLILGIGEVLTTPKQQWATAQPWIVTSAAACLLALFLASFAKQSTYVRKRVEAHTK